MGARNRIYCVASSAEATSPQPCGPASMARLSPAQFTHLEPGCHLSYHVNRTDSSTLIVSLFFFKDREERLYLLQGQLHRFWCCCFHSSLMGQILAGSKLYMSPLSNRPFSLGVSAQSAAVPTAPAASGHGLAGIYSMQPAKHWPK